jgi:hypothetical protein
MSTITFTLAISLEREVKRFLRILSIDVICARERRSARKAPHAASIIHLTESWLEFTIPHVRGRLGNGFILGWR